MIQRSTRPMRRHRLPASSSLQGTNSVTWRASRGPPWRWICVVPPLPGGRFSARTPTDPAFHCLMAAMSADRRSRGLRQSPQQVRTRHDRLPKVQTLDQASLDRFTTELIKAGFHSVTGSDQRDWEGPTLSSFRSLTDAPRMLVRIRDGWPYVHPRIVVPGTTGEHASADGVVCLWGEDDNSLEWLCWQGVVRRADDWCRRVRSGFRPIDL